MLNEIVQVQQQTMVWITIATSKKLVKKSKVKIQYSKIQNFPPDQFCIFYYLVISEHPVECQYRVTTVLLAVQEAIVLLSDFLVSI